SLEAMHIPQSSVRQDHDADVVAKRWVQNNSAGSNVRLGEKLTANESVFKSIMSIVCKKCKVNFGILVRASEQSRNPFDRAPPGKFRSRSPIFLAPPRTTRRIRGNHAKNSTSSAAAGIGGDVSSMPSKRRYSLSKSSTWLCIISVAIWPTR